MKVRDFLYYLYGKVNRAWLTSKFQWLIALNAINDWLANLYFLNDWQSASTFSWQVRKEAFLTTSNDPLKLQTKFPIMWILGFYCAKMPIKDYFMETMCDCPPNQCVCPSNSCEVSCGCFKECERLKMVQVTAGKKLCAGQYQISWGRYNPWFWWQIISAKLPSTCCDDKKCDHVYVEYYWGYNPVTCFDDEIYLPQPLYTVLAYLIASDVLDVDWQLRENQSVNFYNKAQKLLYAFNGKDVIDHSFEAIDMNTKQYPGKNNAFQTIVDNLPSSYIR